jgi:hypothetical protein
MKHITHGNTVAGFIGWLSADIPELHEVEVPRLAASYDRFIQQLEQDRASDDGMRPAPETIDQAHERLGHTAPRVTPADIEANIVSEYYFRAIGEAFTTLKAAIQADIGYAWSWHCNVAMPMLDAKVGVTHEQANEAAACVMQHLFGVDVRASSEWRAMFNTASRSGFDPNGEG